MPPFATNIQLYTLIAVGLFFTVLAIVIPVFIAAYVFFNKFATKDELKETEKRSNERAAAGERALAQVEAHLRNEIQQSRTEGAGQNSRLEAKIDALTNSIQIYVNESTRQTASFEGELKAVKSLVTNPSEHSSSHV